MGVCGVVQTRAAKFTYKSLLSKHRASPGSLAAGLAYAVVATSIIGAFMNKTCELVLCGLVAGVTTQALSQVTFYKDEGFRGDVFSAHGPIDDFGRAGFNDRASSVIVEHGQWEACEHAGYGGHCVELREGSYDSLRGMGLNDRVSSMRPVNGKSRNASEAPNPLAAPSYEYRRRPDEQIYNAPVNSVHAVMGQADRHCWTERERVTDSGRGDRNAAGGVVGAVIGGILGHQIGSGRGTTVVTVGGAVAGAAIGSNQGRDSARSHEQDVQHCDANASGPPQYWDVTYEFHGVQHQVQMSTPPGATVAVNGNGEPRQ